MTHGLFLITYSQYRIFTTEGSQITSSTSTVTVRNDSTYFQFRCSLNSLFSKKCRNIITIFIQRNADIVLFQFIFFSLCGNSSHRFHSFYRILAISCLPTQHQSIRTIIDSIGNIRNLRTSRTRIIDHRMKHLSRNNYRFLSQNTFTNQHTLNTRNTFLRHFYT